MKVIKAFRKCGLSTGRYTGRTVNQSYGKGVLQHSIDLSLDSLPPARFRGKFVRTPCLVSEHDPVIYNRVLCSVLFLLKPVMPTLSIFFHWCNQILASPYSVQGEFL